MPTPATFSSSNGVDARFLRRVHLSSFLLTLLFAGMTAFTLAPKWGLAFLCSGVWSTLNLWVLERLVRGALRPQGRNLIAIAVAAVVKLPVLYGLLVWMLVRGGFDAVPVAIGLSMPLIVVVLKVIGGAMVARTHSTGRATRSSAVTPQPRS